MADSASRLAGTYFDQQLIEPLRQVCNGRKIAMVDPATKGRGIGSVDVFRLADMGKATISYRGPSGDKNNRQRDSVKVTKETIDLPFLFKEFDIPAQDYYNFQNKNIQLDTAGAISAAQVVAEQEDDLIYNGWAGDGTNKTIGGLMTLAGNTVSDAHSFKTYGEPTKAVSAAIGMMSTDKVRAPAYNLSVNPAEFANLLGLQNSAGTVMEMDNLIKILNRGSSTGPGQILETDAIVAGKGMVTPVDPSRMFLELKVPQDAKTQIKTGDYEEISDMTGLIWELMYPHVKQVNAIVLLNDID